MRKVSLAVSFALAFVLAAGAMRVVSAQVQRPQTIAPALRPTTTTLTGTVLANTAAAPWIMFKWGPAKNDILHILVSNATSFVQNGRPVSRSAVQVNMQAQITGYYYGTQISFGTKFNATKVVILPALRPQPANSARLPGGYHPPAPPSGPPSNGPLRTAPPPPAYGRASGPPPAFRPAPAPAPAASPQSAPTHAAPFYKAPGFHAAPLQTGKPTPQRTGVHPVLSPLRLPALHLAPARDFASLATVQNQMHARVSAVQRTFPNVIGLTRPVSYASQQPINRNQLGPQGGAGAYLGLLNNPPGVNDLAPVVSMFANGDRLGDQTSATVPAQQIMSATFFSDPDPNWSAAPGIIGTTMPLNLVPVSTTLASNNTPGVNSLVPVGYVPVDSTSVNLVIPCYYLEGWGSDIYDHAHFEVKVEYEGTTPGVWQTLTEAALDWGNTAGYNAPSGIPDTLVPTAVESGTGYAWIVPITLPEVATTLRVDVYIALYQSTQQNGPTTTVDPNQLDWALPGSIGVNQVNFPFSNGTIVSGSRHEWLASSPFQVNLLPTQLFSADYMPYGIIYMPPGNQSHENFESYQSYGVGTSFSVGNQNSTQIANVQGTSFSLGLKVGFSGVSGGGGVTVSSSTIQTSGITSSNNQTESVSLTTTWKSGWGIAAPTNPQLPASDALQATEEPFWNDRIIVIPNPIYAVWNYASSTEQPGFSAAQLVAYDNSGEPVSIAKLFAGAAQNGYSDGRVSLTSADCTALLALDPFYVAGWQGAAPPVGRAVPATSNPSAVSGNGYWLFDTKTLAQSQQATSQSQGSSQGQGSGNATSIGYSVAGNGVSFQNGQTTVNTLTTTYTATQTNTTGNGIEVGGQIEDTGTLPEKGSPAGASDIQVWLDTVFGGVMFQDPNEPRYSILRPGWAASPVAMKKEVGQIQNALHWKVVRRP